MDVPDLSALRYVAPMVAQPEHEPEPYVDEMLPIQEALPPPPDPEDETQP